MKPFRLDVIAQCVKPLETLKAYAKTCYGLGRIEQQPAHGRKLAVVGGGPSTLKAIEELKNWPGDILSINSTGSYLLREHGIQSTLFTVDPGEPELFNTEGMTKAILATACHPELRKRFANVQLFDMAETCEGGLIGGCTSATRIPAVALKLGYVDVHFFGIDGCRDADRNHISHHCEVQDETDPPLVIRAGGKDYITYLEFIEQSQNLADLITFAPDVFKNRSGGLIDVMLNHRDTWEVVAVSAGLKRKLEAQNGAIGLYEKPYEVTA